MPRVERIVSVDGRLGIILDVPADESEVIILTQAELDAMLMSERKSCARARIAAHLSSQPNSQDSPK